MRPFPTCWRPAALLALAFLLCGAAWADPPGRVGRLAELQGTVWIYDEEQGEWVAAERNRPITTGDHLSTDRDSRAEIHIGSATVRLDEDTHVDVTQLDDDRLRFELKQGSLAARLRNREVASQFEVNTIDGRFLPQGAGHYRIDRDDEVSTAQAWSGTLRFDTTDSALTVAAGQRAEFWKEDGVTHYTWATPPQDRFTDWVLAADREDDRQANRYVSPEMTGSEDLDRYGRWETHPDYGAVWVPTVVVSGWAPYRYGHWAWVRPWGWTWVDDAPWGFAPFHYGRWAWWGGRWCWAPGGYVARPVYAPALVGWVGGPSVNVNIHIGSGPVVGWVPLAPREVYRPWYPLPRNHWRYVNPHTPDRFYRPGEPSNRAVMYTNRGVPGGVTVVPADALKRRQPIANVATRMDPHLAQQLVQQPGTHAAPPPPAVVSTRPSPVVPRPPNAAAARPGGGSVPPAPVDGRRSHGVIVPPNRREAAQPERRAQPPQRVETHRPAVPPSPPQLQQQGGSRETRPHPRTPPAPPPAAQPVAPAAPPVRSVPAREAEPRHQPNLPTAGGREEAGRRVPAPQPPRENREVRGEGQEHRGEGRESRGGGGRPGGPRQQVQ